MTRKELLIKAMNFEEVPRVPVSTLSGATWAIKQEGISPEELLRLPDGHAGFDASWFCYIVGRKDDSVTGFRITADCHRLLPQLRTALAFYGGIKCVHIYV